MNRTRSRVYIHTKIKACLPGSTDLALGGVMIGSLPRLYITNPARYV